MMGMIGISIGITGFLLHQTIHLIGDIKWDKAQQLYQVGDDK